MNHTAVLVQWQNQKTAAAIETGYFIHSSIFCESFIHIRVAVNPEFIPGTTGHEAGTHPGWGASPLKDTIHKHLHTLSHPGAV